MPMYAGSSLASSVTITEVMYGRMFREITLRAGVPRQRDARLYSLSRMISTCVRMKKAIPSQPVTVSAKMKLQNPAPIT